MTTPLRLGFLFSGLLHVAVVAAFSLPAEPEIPAVDEPGPLTLRLAMFQPAQPEVPQPPVVEPQPQAVAAPPVPPPPEPPEEVPPVVEPPAPVEPPPPVVEQIQPKPPVSQPRPVVRRVKKPRAVVKKPARVRPEKALKRETQAIDSSPASSSAVKLAAVNKPRPMLGAQEKQHYLAALAAEINRNKHYPLGSRRRGEQGKVVVHFLVQKNGEISDLSIVESSGSRRLDAAALKTLRRVSPFRPIPEALGKDDWSISEPIAFSLRS